MCVSTEMFAYAANGKLSFPLDDAWIHLQFARNIHDYGSYSYFRNEMVTSGSTSPLFTALLSAGFFLTPDDMILSYALGSVFLIFAAVYLYKIVSHAHEKLVVLSAIAGLLLVCEPRLIWASLSGMETTLFIFLLLGTFYYYKIRKGIHLGVAGGLLLWARPEAILLIIIIGLDFAYHTFVVEGEGSRKRSALAGRIAWIKKPAVFILIAWTAYFGFNLWLSGSIFPNTYAAKLKYYAGGGDDFPAQVYHYFRDGHMVVIAALALVALWVALKNAAKRRPVPMFVPLLFSVEMFFVYWKDLPYLYQEGRYLMPVLPFVILAGADGAATLSEAAGKFLPRLGRMVRGEAVIVLILALPAIQFAVAGWKERSQYADYCDYISKRQVATAVWIRDNLADGVRIATHDVGAIAYYSGKQIVDMVGLISPEMIPRLGSLDGLIGFMNSQRVTHLALLKNWFEIDNQDPLFSTDPKNPEIMEVFEYDPKVVHFLTRDVGQLFEAGEFYASRNDFNTAIRYLAQGIQRDPRSSKGHRLLAGVYFRMGKHDEAAKEFRVTLQLHPGDAEARAGLDRIAMQQPEKESR